MPPATINKSKRGTLIVEDILEEKIEASKRRRFKSYVTHLLKFQPPASKNNSNKINKSSKHVSTGDEAMMTFKSRTLSFYKQFCSFKEKVRLKNH